MNLQICDPVTPAKMILQEIASARKHLSRLTELSGYHESPLARERLAANLTNLWRNLHRVQNLIVKAFDLGADLLWEEDA